MNINYGSVCYGCFREKPDPANPVCPFCDFDADAEPVYPLALPLGSILNGRYLVGKPLGQGGFGITYLAFDMTLQVKVAVKEFLPTGMISRGTDRSTVVLLSRRNDNEFSSSKEKFLDEARILARLADASGIVKVQNYFTENNTAYFTMEYVDGISLKDLVAQQGGKLPWALTNGYLLPIASALVQVHAEDLLHRDISPDNIFITRKGASKLLDFGAARSSVGDSRSMSIILKHGFAPEEQYRTHGKQGPWTDIYALAATYYYCLTGSLVPDSIDRLHTDTLVPPSRLGVSLPPTAEAALLKALAVNAEDRFVDMQSFMDAVTGKKPVAVPPTLAATPPVVSRATPPVAIPAATPPVAASFAPSSFSAQHTQSTQSTQSMRPSQPTQSIQYAQSAQSAQAFPPAQPSPSAPSVQPSPPGQHTPPSRLSGVASRRLPLIIGGGAAAVILIVFITVLVVLNPFSDRVAEEEAANNANMVAQQTDQVDEGGGTTDTDPDVDPGPTPPPPTTVNGYYYSTEGPIAIIPSGDWEIDDSDGSLMLTSPTETAIISFFQVEGMSPASFAAQKDAMLATAAESFEARNYAFVLEETRNIAGYEFYLLSFTMELEDGTYPTQYYVTSDNARGGIAVMLLEFPDASDEDRTDMMNMIGSLLVL